MYACRKDELVHAENCISQQRVSETSFKRKPQQVAKLGSVIKVAGDVATKPLQEKGMTQL